jgi:isopentenyl-diphosphate Delta-isomerase
MSRPRIAAASRRGSVERDRKAEHIRLALDARMQSGDNAFDRYRFEHCALPEMRFEEVDLSCTFLEVPLRAPLLISCMTGGTADATRINRNLARAAESERIAVGVGSQRKALEDPRTVESFRIRPHAPTTVVLGNLGAVQLNYGYGIDECRAAVRMNEANALALHLNPLQEAIQPEGQRDFSSLLPKIGEIARELEVPLIVKEVGCGISADVAKRLLAHGVSIVDTAGLGGTNWARIEAARADDAELGERFADWGIPTPEAILRLRELPGLTIVGSGGVRTGVDVAKALACGAHLVGLAYPFLRAADESEARVVETVRRIVDELRICMFCLGVRTIEELRRVKLRRPRFDDER